MKSPAPAPRRKRFVLAGPSVRLDPTQFAVRGDLADLDLADRIFAPHYARATPYRCLKATSIRSSADASAPETGQLAAGGNFALLDISGGWAWGRTDKAVGYVAADTIAPA